ncbi:ABC transporter ATP-binding protein [Paenibacillus thermotolerans]|uniref:ABC transporter ATP-binding protein n=1 Tax=Paenibacillus thermotolerans TaxID=3027807 RepID=UPI0023676E84|nr:MULTISPECIES: ABC transporter ATP-binding protein [unclassified Paenibacillus]
MNVPIRLDHISKSYGSQPILRDITLDIPEGHIFGLLGPSGAGKTTLVKLIAGIEAPTSGTVHVLGERMPNYGNLSRIGYMAQSDALYSELSAKDNLDFFAAIYGLRGAKKKERINASLELVGLATDRSKPVHKFSGGMKRRLSLAIAMLHEPPVLILDEPTVGIDPVLRLQIWEELHRIKAKGTAIVVTTHVMDEADKCGTLAMLRDGCLIAAGTPEELKRRSDVATIEEAFLVYGREQA